MGNPKKESSKNPLGLEVLHDLDGSMSQNVRHLSSKELSLSKDQRQRCERIPGAMLLGANKALAGKRKLSGTFREHETHGTCQVVYSLASPGKSCQEICGVACLLAPLPS